MHVIRLLLLFDWPRATSPAAAASGNCLCTYAQSEESETSVRHAAICEKMSESERNGERYCSKLDGNILKPICTSIPKKRCLDLCDSDTSSVNLGGSTTAIHQTDSNSSEQCSDKRGCD